MGFALPVTIIILMSFLSPLSRAIAVPQRFVYMLWWIACECKAQLLGVGVGEEGEAASMKSNMEIYNTIWKIDSQWEFAV